MMKKLGILVMALVLVVGMSVGVMAKTGELPTEESISFHITAEPMAIIEHDISSFNLTISNLDDSVFSGYKDFTITTNTSDISILIEQEYTNWNEIFGDTGYNEDQLLWNWQDSEQPVNNNWLLSPDVWIRDKDQPVNNQTTSGGYPGEDVADPSSFEDRSGMEAIELEQGVNPLEIGLNLNINQDNDLANAEWYDFEGGKTLNGNIVITVAGN